MQVIQSGRMQTFSNMDVQEDPRIADEGRRGDLDPVPYPMGIIAPLTVRDHVVGAIKLYYARGSEVDRTQLAIARGLAELLSTQLSAYELDRQAELTARAEVKALQAQINPHFLFNTLNTIASLTRTDPAKARDLLREFAVFYRKTLQSSQQTIPLSEELAQTRRYLKIEKARFGEDRIIETENVETGCDDVLVPGFIVQPIVENAVRHAMRDDGPLHIDVQAVVDGGDIMIAVADDGLGMDESVAERLLSGSSQESSDSSKGTGIALKNVAERLERFYGTGSGVEIMSKVGEGTCVTLRLVGAAPALQQCTEA
jgi:two-component system sensor histidine kinase LytS